MEMSEDWWSFCRSQTEGLGCRLCAVRFFWFSDSDWGSCLMLVENEVWLSLGFFGRKVVVPGHLSKFFVTM